ncbi:MAG: hypothetical protein KatS3mg105_4617 [Gemmatales bacterium]|nr:MAG: hypothetical protein KatS3mg105_4617 [Gemmatales bacterium]
MQTCLIAMVLIAAKPMIMVEDDVDRAPAHSHRDVPVGKVDRRELLRRLRQSKTIQQRQQNEFAQYLKKLLKKEGKQPLDTQELKNILNGLGAKDEDILFRELDKFLQELRLDPGDRNRILQKLQQFLDGTSPTVPETPPDTSTIVPPLKLPVRPIDPPEHPPLPGSDPPDVPVEPPTVDNKEDDDTSRKLADWLLKQTKKIKGRPLEDSSVLDSIRRDMMALARDLRTGKLQLGNNGDSFAMPGWLRTLGLETKLKNFRLPKMDKIHLPGMGSWKLPKINWPQVDAPQLPNVPSSPVSAPRVGGMSPWLFLAVGACLLAALVLKRLMQKGNETPLSAADYRRKLPRVKSWADIVVAFEVLSLCQLGPRSRTWNHLEIAAALGRDEHQRQAAANRLAELYERARYAPDARAISDEDLAFAQGAILSLAGNPNS